MRKIKKKTIRQALNSGWAMIGLVLSLVAFRQFVWPRIEAGGPTFFDSPSVHLIKSQVAAAPNQVAVDVNLNTARKKIIEADFVLKYDPQALSVKKEGIKLYNQALIQTELGKGMIDFTLLNQPQSGQIATIIFDIIDRQARSTRLELKSSSGNTESILLSL